MTASFPVTIGRAHDRIKPRCWDSWGIGYDQVDGSFSNELEYIVHSGKTNNLLLVLVHLFHLLPCSRLFLLAFGCTISKGILPTYVCLFRGVNIGTFGAGVDNGCNYHHDQQLWNH